MGETVSLFGTQVTTLALPLTAALALDLSGDELGIIRFLQGVSFVVLPIPLGLWVDQRRHRPVLIWTNLVRAALVGAVPLLAAAGLLHVGALYVVAFGVGVCWVLFDVCWLSYVPSVVTDRRQLVEANSKLGVSFSAAQVGDAGLAGVLVQFLTAPYALAVDAASYLVSAASLSAIRRPEPAPAPRDRTATTRSELAAEVRWVFGHPHLRVVGLLGTLHNFFTIWIQPVFILFAVDTLDLSSGWVGFVLSAGAVGGLLGSAFAGRLLARWPFGRLYVVAVLVTLVARLLIPMAAGPRAVAVGVLVASYFFTNASGRRQHAGHQPPPDGHAEGPHGPHERGDAHPHLRPGLVRGAGRRLRRQPARPAGVALVGGGRLGPVRAAVVLPPRSGGCAPSPTPATGRPSEGPSVERPSGDAELPLSFAQEQLWFLDQLDPGHGTYNIPLAFRLREPLDIDALTGALNQLLTRHEALRATFSARPATPTIAEFRPLSLAVEDVGPEAAAFPAACGPCSTTRPPGR